MRVANSVGGSARGVAASVDLAALRTLCGMFGLEAQMETETIIRVAGARDAAVIAALNHHVHDLHVAHRPDYYKQTQSNELGDWFRALLDKPTVRAWVAEIDGEPIGYALAIIHERGENAFCSARRFLELDQIAVSTSFRRRGIARRLVDEVVRWARDQTIGEVELSSAAFNREAHDFFVALGFTLRTVRLGRQTA